MDHKKTYESRFRNSGFAFGFLLAQQNPTTLVTGYLPIARKYAK
jgi:hypothetical protein